MHDTRLPVAMRTAPDYSPEAIALAQPIVDWILREARRIENPDDVMRGYGTRLLAAGVDLARMSSAMPTLHSERRGFGRYWYRDGTVRDTIFRWENRDTYEASPYFTAHQTGEWVVLHPMQANEQRYPIEDELRAEGITHYICVPVFFSDDLNAGMTYATKNPNGFSDQAMEILRIVEPAVSILMDLRATTVMLNDLLRIYLGEEPQRRVLSGEVRRGEVIRIRSAVLFADMASFTALTADRSAEETAALLNAYYDCVVPAVEFNGGEVLKYIGDGVLAIFRVEDEGSDQKAVAAALDAARDALESVNTRQDGSRLGLPLFEIRIALHVGEVAYGNVGSGARLDFTVIGSSVNMASRIADVAGALGEPLAVSKAFADQMAPGEERRLLGEFDLKGFPDPQPVYTVPV